MLEPPAPTASLARFEEPQGRAGYGARKDTAAAVRSVGVEAVVSVPGAEPWSAQGSGARASIGVVVIHGFTANAIGTRPLGQRLAAEGYAVEVPLLPGHGTSHRDLGTTRYADWIAAAERVLDHLRRGCDTVVIVGHSTGGTMALDLASRRVDDVAGVAVVNPVVLSPMQPLAKFARVLQYAVPYLPRDLAGMPSDDIARPGVEEGAYGIVSARAAQSLIEALPRVRSQLHALTQPLLIAWSPEDHTVDPSSARALPDLVGTSEITEVVCDRSYHVVMLDYDAPKLEEALVAFVGKVAGV